MSSPAPQFEGINSLALCLLYGPALTTVPDHWEDYSLDYMGLCWQSDLGVNEESEALGNVGTFPPSLLSSPQLSIPVLEACHMAYVFRRLYSQLLPSGMSILSDKGMKPDKLLNSFNLG